MEKVVVGRAGFDLLGCTGFYIEPESMEILKCSIKNGCILTDGKVTVSDNGSVHIIEREFEFRFFRSNITKEFHTLLKVHAARADGNNLQNMSVTEVWAKIRKAEEVLQFKYGLAVQENKIEMRSAEINRTFVTIDEFQAYKRVLELVALVVLMKGGKKYDVSAEKLKNAFSHQGLMIAKKSYGYRVYDKAAQMAEKMDGITFDKPLMRVEIVYVDKQPLLTDFKTLDLCNITDTMLTEVYNHRMEQIRIDVIDYLNQKLLYMPGYGGRNNTIPNIIAEHRKWGSVLSALSSYEANYGVPCMLDSRDMLTAIDSLIKIGILNDYNAERYYMDFLETYKNIPEAVTLYGEQRELFEDFFEKVMGSCEIVKMRN